MNTLHQLKNNINLSYLLPRNDNSNHMQDSAAAASSVGRPNPAQDMCFDLQICPDLILAGIAVFSAAAFFFLYQAITMNGKRKRKRAAMESLVLFPSLLDSVFWAKIPEIFFAHGMSVSLLVYMKVHPLHPTDY